MCQPLACFDHKQGSFKVCSIQIWFQHQKQNCVVQQWKSRYHWLNEEIKINVISKTSLLTWCISTYAQACEENNGRKNTLVAWSCVLSDTWFRDLSWGLKINSNILVRNSFLLKNVTSEGTASHNVFYYQQPSIAYLVSFDANIYLEKLPIVSSAFYLKKRNLPQPKNTPLMTGRTAGVDNTC